MFGFGDVSFSICSVAAYYRGLQGGPARTGDNKLILTRWQACLQSPLYGAEGVEPSCMDAVQDPCEPKRKLFCRGSWDSQGPFQKHV